MQFEYHLRLCPYGKRTKARRPYRSTVPLHVGELFTDEDGTNYRITEIIHQMNETPFVIAREHRL
jgi:hypothetical protein